MSGNDTTFHTLEINTAFGTCVCFFMVGSVLFSAKRKEPVLAQRILEFSSRIMLGGLNSANWTEKLGQRREMWLSSKNKEVALAGAAPWLERWAKR